MYKLKNKFNLIFLIGIVSYLYLYLSLINKKYEIIFIYFIFLFLGYFIIGNKIFLYNLLIIIFDILKNKFILREGIISNKKEEEEDADFDSLVESTEKDAEILKDEPIDTGLTDSDNEELADNLYETVD